MGGSLLSPPGAGKLAADGRAGSEVTACFGSEVIVCIGIMAGAATATFTPPWLAATALSSLLTFTISTINRGTTTITRAWSTLPSQVQAAFRRAMTEVTGNSDSNFDQSYAPAWVGCGQPMEEVQLFSRMLPSSWLKYTGVIWTTSHSSSSAWV